MTDDENNLSDDLSFMSLLTCLDDANFDKLFPRTPDEYQKHENSDDMLIKKKIPSKNSSTDMKNLISNLFLKKLI